MIEGTEQFAESEDPVANMPSWARNIFNEVRQCRKETYEIKLALSGNSRLGHRGLVARLEQVESQVDRFNKKFLVWGGIVTGVCGTLQFLLSWVQ